MNDLTRLIKICLRQEATLSSIHTVLNQMLERMPDQEEHETPEEELLYLNEVIDILKISESTFYRYRKQGLLKPVGPGGNLFRKTDILELSERIKKL